jgi:broad specificity phosphatase PhoE
MSLLLVVRHGQASFLADNYDKLSPLGEQQARLLGSHWLARSVELTHVVYGPAERQIRTGEIVGDVYRAAGRHWPQPQSLAALDEFPAEKVVRTFLPALEQRYPHLAAFVQQFHQTTELSLKRRLFDRVLREVCERWLAGEVADSSFESWPQFCHRVQSAIASILDAASSSSTIAVFTSAGPKAATAGLALGLSPAATLNLTWSARNAAFSEFLFTRGRFSLSTFNETPHLADPALVTYR